MTHAEWKRLTPHEIAAQHKKRLVIGPFGSSLKTSDYRSDGVPLIFVRDIRAADFSTPRHFVSQEKARELRAHIAQAGDVLITKMGDPPGDACIYSGSPAVITADCIRLRVTEGVDARYVVYAMHSPQVRLQMERITSGVAQRKVSLARFRSGVSIPVPTPDEQRRIVEALDDHLSRLDAAENYVKASLLRATALVKSVLLDVIPDQARYPESWKRSTVGESGHVELGRQRHPDWHSGPNMRPYLRVANVFEDRIDTSDLKEMHWPGDTFERFRLHPGDVLLNEGQTPELLGRPAIYRGDPPEVAFTNSLLRFKCREDVLPEFALLVFRRHMHAGRFTRESRITTNIAHLSASRLKPIEFPIPPLEDQERIVAIARERLDAIGRLQTEAETAISRATALRRAVLGAAFAGWLTEAAPPATTGS